MACRLQLSCSVQAVCLVVALSVAVPAVASGEPEQYGGAKIRADEYLSNVLQDGMRRSSTLRELVDNVEAGNVVVYLQTAVSLKRQSAGAITWVGSSGGIRFVCARIKRGPHINELLATIAHELHHVLEIGGAPWVKTAEGLRQLYQRLGEPLDMARAFWDTSAARATGEKVARELNAYGAANADDER